MVVNFGVNYLAVIIAAIVAVVIGFIWYSPQALGRLWGSSGMPAGPNPGPMEGVGGLVLSFVSAWVLAVLALNLGGSTLGDGVMLGVICWLGFQGTLTAADTLFRKLPWGQWLVNNGHHVIVQAVMGAIILSIK
ncbi:MAG TPA: DUF1761 domain-containing protein [Candidatus Acidoferrales bacterium]|nr:DUF1761 domain-containing protein [Candidatus Acidoferrales bacterium]